MFVGRFEGRKLLYTWRVINSFQKLWFVFRMIPDFSCLWRVFSRELLRFAKES